MRYGHNVSVVPKINRPRSGFRYNKGRLTSCNVGELLPVFVQEIYPGDTFKIKMDCLNRLSSSFVKSPMVNLVQDTMFFFVPHRLTWDHFEEFLGTNKDTAWANTKEYLVPMINYSVPNSGVGRREFFKSVIHHLGAKPSSNGEISALLPRAFALIYDEWFRNENLIDPMLVSKSDTAETYVATVDWAPDTYTGKLPKVSRLKDYFSACLPAPQKGDLVTIGLSGFAPVYAIENKHALDNYNASPLTWAARSADNPLTDAWSDYTPSSDAFVAFGQSILAPFTTPVVSSGMSSADNVQLSPDNLVANLKEASSVSINDLRLATQLQMFYELQARGGTRYQEILANEWGVIGSDSRLQIPEFLGGKSTPLNVIQVPQTSASSDGSPQANISAYGQSMLSEYIVKSFNEHGYLIGVTCIRMKHLYQQGNERFLNKKTRLDWYNPVFAGIGEQPVWTREIYANLQPADYNNRIFGYMPYAEDLRIRPSEICGQMSDYCPDSLGVWQAGDTYGNAPVLGKEFIEEDAQFLDKCLAVPSTSQDQFILDINFNIDSIREVTIDGRPGKLDHIYAGGIN